MKLDFYAPTGCMIQEYLDLNKMSYIELADKLNITKEYMEKIMTSAFPLSDELSDELSKIFGIDSNYFKDYEKGYRDFLKEQGK